MGMRWPKSLTFEELRLKGRSNSNCCRAIEFVIVSCGGIGNMVCGPVASDLVHPNRNSTNINVLSVIFFIKFLRNLDHRLGSSLITNE